MTEDELTILAIKGVISELPQDQQQACEALIKQIRELMKQAGSPVGECAIALIGAELQAEAD